MVSDEVKAIISEPLHDWCRFGSRWSMTCNRCGKCEQSSSNFDSLSFEHAEFVMYEFNYKHRECTPADKLVRRMEERENTKEEEQGYHKRNRRPFKRRHVWGWRGRKK